MDDRQCPDCGEPLKPYARSCPCGWTSSPTRKRDAKAEAARQATADINRCSFEAGSRRCRYIATIFENQVTGCRRGVCRGHFRFTAQSGAATLEQSEIHVPPDFDYSSANIVRLTRERFEGTREGIRPREELPL